MPTKLGPFCLAVGLVLALQAIPGCGRVIGLGNEYYVVDEGGAGVVSSRGGASGEGFGGNGDSGGRAGSAGNDISGDAGAPPNALLCQMYPIPPRVVWVPTASSHGPNDPVSGLTDNMPARWSSGKPQSGDEWIQIDFGKTVGIRSINLQQGHGTDVNDYPRMYSVTISDIFYDFGGPALFAGEGTSGVSTTTILSQPHAGRYLLIKQLGTSLSWWSVDELEVGCIDD